MTPRFDAVIHAPNRLQIVSVLSVASEAAYGTLRETLGVSDSVLSKHLRTLEDAGYLTLNKPTVAGRVRTTVSLTGAGRRAFEGHIAELKRLAGGAL